MGGVEKKLAKVKSSMLLGLSSLNSFLNSKFHCLLLTSKNDKLATPIFEKNSPLNFNFLDRNLIGGDKFKRILP